MKENVLDVLLYLFEHYFHEDPDAVRDRESLQGGLLRAGFGASEIGRAFEWLDGLAQHRHENALAPHSVPDALRLYSEPELARLDEECRGLLLFLEQNGVLDARSRELVIDRAMALDDEQIDVEDLKWVVLMVLFNQPGQEAAFAWMESHMFDAHGEALH
ncbi:MAG: protein Smg [Lysobacteraceae bacterium]|nr:MAG: protein Smg [Xanthomonadaceae bacterium]